MSNLTKANLSISEFSMTTSYQHIRPASDQLLAVGQFLNTMITASTLEDAKSKLSEQAISWDYYTNWMDGQKSITDELSTNRSLRRRVKKAPADIATYLQSVQLSQRLIQLDVELEKYPLYSTKWRKAHETYTTVFNDLKTIDPDYVNLFLHTPSVQTYQPSPWVQKLSETGCFLALSYLAFFHLQESANNKLTEAERTEHFNIGFEYLDKACVRGSTEAIITVGDIYRRLFSETDDDHSSSKDIYFNMIKHYDLATRRGNPNAKAKLGNALLLQKISHDPGTGTTHGTLPQIKPALIFLTNAAKTDSTFAHFYLGGYYVAYNETDFAIQHFERAAENEHIAAMHELDALYTQKARQKNPKIAAPYKVKAAENMYKIGVLYEEGHCLSGKIDFKEAQTCYIKAMKMDIGDNPAPQIKSALALSRLAHEGKGLPEPNARLSFAYLKKAADMGDMSAILGVACLYLAPNHMTLQENWDQGRLYLDKIKASKHSMNDSELNLINDTIQNLIAQNQLAGQTTTDRRLQLNEFILDLAKLIHQTDIIIAAYKTIGLIYAYEIFDKVKAISYYNHAISLGDLNSYLDIGFTCLDGNDPNNLPDISYAMQTFKTGVKSGLDLTTDVIDAIEAKLFSYEHVPEMKDAFNKAIYYDIKFLKDYNWLERTFFSGTFASSEDQNQIPLYIQWLEIETVLDTNHTKDLLAAFKRNYSKACAQSI